MDSHPDEHLDPNKHLDSYCVQYRHEHLGTANQYLFFNAYQNLYGH
jgi:hypothetical protein